MRISILGAVVYDEIITHLGEKRESYGGITYNIAAFSSIVSDMTKLVPVSNVAEDHFDQVTSLLSGYPQVELAELKRVPGKLTHAKLTYETVSRRDESVKHMMTPLTPERLVSCRESDAVLMNFVNGTEIDLSTFEGLREQTKAFLHLDVHSKVGKWDSEGKKTLVGFPDWREWVRHLDSIQMNEFECELIVGRKLTSYDDFVEAASEIVERGAPIVTVTLGPLGSVLTYRREAKIYSSVCPAADVDNVIDTTGCGDSFSAGFMWSYLQCGNPVAANAAANIVGGVNCTISGIGHLEKARGALEQIPRWFPDLAEKLDAGWPGDEL
jgi:adenosine kinase